MLHPQSPAIPAHCRAIFCLRPNWEQRASSLLSCRSQFSPRFPNPGCEEPLGAKTLHIFSGCSSFRPQHFLARTRQKLPELRGFYHL